MTNEQDEQPTQEGLLHKFDYECKHCGAQWKANFYDMRRLTDQRVMPCGCSWCYLSMPVREVKSESH